MPLTIDEINQQVMPLAALLATVQSLRQRLAATNSVSFNFTDEQAASVVISDLQFIGALSNLFAAQETAITARLGALGISP